MKAVQSTVVLAVLVLTGLAGFASGASSAPVSRLVIATGGEGGVYHALGTAFAGAVRRRWSADTAVLTTAASVENLRLIADGRAHVGFATVDSAALAVNGEGPFAHALPIVALAGLYDDYLQIVVSADGPIHEIADLRGRRVSTGSAGSGTEIVAARVMEAAGLGLDRIDRHRLSASASAAALGRGEIDAFFFTGGLPTPAVAALAAGHQIRILPVGQLVDELQARYGEVYQPRSIPANLYSVAGEVTTVGIANVLVVRADMPTAAAKALTALLFQAKTTLNAAHAEARRLDHRTALVTFPVPLHPGAAKYYQESKVMAAVSGS
ncbi:TAXI family TRAP transporter solute-binding subunit [Spirillospora sp. NPDC048911]|uniref:TAXI family TRAP transporter solute-binding subunit n=1 Tax=Spirillospora sp. NPDC048911 TaxID=3364527 RepID=UPI0037171B50